MGLDVMRYKLTSRKVKNGGRFTICKEGEESENEFYKLIVEKGFKKWIRKEVATYYDIEKYINENFPGYHYCGCSYGKDGGRITLAKDKDYVGVDMSKLPTFNQTNLIINHGPELAYQRKGMWGFQPYLANESFAIGQDMMLKVYTNSEFDEPDEEYDYNPKRDFYKNFVKPVNDKTIVWFSW